MTPLHASCRTTSRTPWTSACSTWCRAHACSTPVNGVALVYPGRALTSPPTTGCPQRQMRHGRLTHIRRHGRGVLAPGRVLAELKTPISVTSSSTCNTAASTTTSTITTTTATTTNTMKLVCSGFQSLYYPKKNAFTLPYVFSVCMCCVCMCVCVCVFYIHYALTV